MKKQLPIKREKVKGSGRKKGKPSKVIRVPHDKIEAVEQVLYGPVDIKMKSNPIKLK